MFSQIKIFMNVEKYQDRPTIPFLLFAVAWKLETETWNLQILKQYETEKIIVNKRKA